ncbi:MAG TPA: putative molybdenum carrier protein [Chthoniobacterales bacterium]|nr:putative molybdenum carrier protein [Chthoniobacterales bacterium]
MKIVSGGQTGVDRAALDVAMKHRVPCGGWCPEDRSDENGKIPDRYPMTPLKKGGPHERTARNVRDSDGTIVIYFHELSGGTAYTVGCCIEQRVAHRVIDAAKYSPEDAVPLMGAFIRDHDVEILNIAGPRASEWAGGYDYAFRAIDVLLSRMKFSGRRGR